MKKTAIMICLITITLVICACNAIPQGQASGYSAPASSNQSNVSNGNPSKDNTKYLDVSSANALPLPMQLSIGILKLQGTENEVDAETAKQLLTLWKAVKNLSNSDTASTIEIEALYKQIQRTMTKEQIEAISNMKLSSDNLMQISKELGLAVGNGFGMGTISEERKATMEAAQASGGGGMMGGGPGGGMPGGGMPGGMPGGAPPGQNSSSSGNSQNRPSQSSQMDSMLVDAVIKYLKSKIQ